MGVWAMGLREWVLTGAGVAAIITPAQATAAALIGRHADHVLGASFDLMAAGADQARADAAMAAALQEIARLDPILSGWRSDSELAALNGASDFVASPDLFAVIAACENWRARTGGAFSARVGRVTQIWRDAEASGVAPSAHDLAAAARAAQGADVRLAHATRRIERPESVRFEVDALAKGYVIDCVLRAARRAAPGMSGLLVDIGGDVRVWTAPWRPVGWRLGVADPAQPHDNAPPLTTVSLRNGALAVSGGGARDRVVAGRRHTHILDPRTGQPVTHVKSAAVIAATAATADALAAAVMVMPTRDGATYVSKASRVGALVVDADGGTHASGSWADFSTSPSPACQAVATPGAALPWPAGFSVRATYEIPANAAANYRRPYVSVWISDESRKLIRTLIVQGPEARWREENYIWWRRFERLTPEAVQAVARPTRAPGRYDLIWDGRDNAGQLAPRGKYTLNIEASREHGGHSFQSIPLDIGDTAMDLGSEASQELGATRVHYGRSP